LSAPPTPPAELNQKGRKIFGFCPRESASAAEAQSERTIQSRVTTRSARATLVGILLEVGSDFFKQTPPTRLHLYPDKVFSRDVFIPLLHQPFISFILIFFIRTKQVNFNLSGFWLRSENKLIFLFMRPFC